MSLYPCIPALKGFRSLEKEGVELHPTAPSLYVGNILSTLPFWLRFLRSLNPLIVHFNDPCIVGSIAASVACIRYRVMTYHTPELDRQYNSIGKFLEKLAFRSQTRCIFTSEQSRVTGIQRDDVTEEKSAIIPYGLRPEWFSPINVVERERIRSELGIKEADVVILCPARLSHQKRHDVLIEAARTVIAASERAIFLLAGEGELRAEIECASTMRISRQNAVAGIPNRHSGIGDGI